MINQEHYLGLQVSLDVSTCDQDYGNRYFGRVTSLSESNGEIVLLIEEPEKNFDITVPLPSFDGYNEDIVRELQAAFIQAINKVGIKIRE